MQLLHYPADARLAPQPHAKDIVAEAKALLVDGVKELNLISQDSTYYGLDLRRTTAAPSRRRRNFCCRESAPGKLDHHLHAAP